VSRIRRKSTKWTERTQAIATSILCLIALVTSWYGYSQYQSFKSEKRPYLGLDVNIESNFTKSYPIMHPKLGKDVLPSQMLAEKREIQDQIEEIIINLCCKNTGPIGAKDVQIITSFFPGDRFTIDGKDNPNSKINDMANFFTPDISKIIEYKTFGKINLMPREERITPFMFHRKEKEEKYNIMKRDLLKTNPLYLVYFITYKSISDNKRYVNLGVYKLYNLPAYTRIYNAKQIVSSVK